MKLLLSVKGHSQAQVSLKNRVSLAQAMLINKKAAMRASARVTLERLKATVISPKLKARTEVTVEQMNHQVCTKVLLLVEIFQVALPG